MVQQVYHIYQNLRLIPVNILDCSLTVTDADGATDSALANVTVKEGKYRLRFYNIVVSVYSGHYSLVQPA